MTKIYGFLEQENVFNTSILMQDTRNLGEKTTNFEGNEGWSSVFPLLSNINIKIIFIFPTLVKKREVILK